MENASKAIIIAGSVLMGIVVLSLLVAFFNNVRNLQQTKAETESIAKDVEFNKKFEAYNRDVYGSELLSIAKFIEDYNLREGGENKDYKKIELEVNVSEDLDAILFKKGKYNVEKLNNTINNIENGLENIKNKTILFDNGSRRIYQLAGMRTKEIEDLGDPKPTYSNYEYDIGTYNTYKSLLSQIKQKTFKCTGFEYEQYTGRVTKMKYKL